MRIGTTIKNRKNSITGKIFLFSKIAATADPFIMSVPKVSNANCQENSSRFVAALKFKYIKIYDLIKPEES